MDRVEQDDLEIEHFHVERIRAEILTKPLQVRSFKEFRAELMNCPVEYKDESTCEYLGKTT